VSVKLLTVAACALVDTDGRVLLAQRPAGKSMVERVRTSNDSPVCTISNVSRPARRPPTVMANVPASTFFSTGWVGLNPPHVRMAGATTASTTDATLRSSSDSRFGLKRRRRHSG